MCCLFDWITPEIIISTCALAFTAYQAHLSRVHNKLSVRPSLTTVVNTTTDKNNNIAHEATLINAGLGPAYIKSFQVLIDNKHVNCKTPLEIHNSIVSNFKKYSFINNACYYMVLRKQAVVASDERIVIGTIVVKPSVDMNHDDFNKIHILIEYESAYGEGYIYDSRLHMHE